jgi:hypothetical protein
MMTTDNSADEDQGAGLGQLAELLEHAPAGRLLHGQFSLYKTDEGGLHVAYRIEGADEDGHLPVPAAVLRIGFAAAAGRGPLAMLAKLAGRG